MFDEPDEKTTNEDLTGRVMLGNKHAFEVFIHRHQRSVLNFIFRFMGNRTDAEDLTQAVSGNKIYQLNLKFQIMGSAHLSEQCLFIHFSKWGLLPTHLILTPRKDDCFHREGLDQ